MLGDNLIHQSISLLHVKDPLFKRMGASRLSRFAIDGKPRPSELLSDGIVENTYLFSPVLNLFLADVIVLIWFGL